MKTNHLRGSAGDYGTGAEVQERNAFQSTRFSNSFFYWSEFLSGHGSSVFLDRTNILKYSKTCTPTEDTFGDGILPTVPDGSGDVPKETYRFLQRDILF